MLKTGDRVVLAVSGGPDSLCLLYLFLELAQDYGLKLVMAHLDHCLRPEGKTEAQGVLKLAESLKIPCETEAVDVGRLQKELGVGEEEAGRKARYDLLLKTAQKYQATKIATGHHRDDLAETVLLNIIRGSSVDGLAGIRPKRRWQGFYLIRPLLCLYRQEIEAACRAQGLKPYTDSSNLETTYKRNQLRLELIPHLEKHYNPKIRENLASLAELAARDRLLLQKMAKTQYKKLAKPGRQEGALALKTSALKALPEALQGRVLYLCLAEFISPGLIERHHLEKLIDLTKKNQTGLKLSLPGRLWAETTYGELHFRRAEKKQDQLKAPLVLPVPGEAYLPGGAVITAALKKRAELSWPPEPSQAYLDHCLLPAGPLGVRLRQTSDAFHPQGAPGRKKLKDFFIDQKVPRHRRDTTPLVTLGGEIIWVAGFRIADPYSIKTSTKEVLVLEYKT